MTHEDKVTKAVQFLTGGAQMDFYDACDYARTLGFKLVSSNLKDRDALLKKHNMTLRIRQDKYHHYAIVESVFLPVVAGFTPKRFTK